MQVDPSTSRKHGGTGIGLSISKSLVGRMNGEIGFVSVPNIGSTFTFTAVFGKGSSTPKEQKCQQMNSQPNSVSSDFQGMTALVVDPRPIRANVSKYHIQRLRIQVDVVSDLNQGLSQICIGNKIINMILIEQEVWEMDASISTDFINNLRKFDSGFQSKLFVLGNSISFSSVNTTSYGVCKPTVITKPLRASMLATFLQQAMAVENKGNPRNGEIPSVWVHNLLLGKKIIIVDDNLVNLKVATGALKRYGADVIRAETGKEATQLLKPPHQFDACFMDIQMPEMDGFEATKMIRDMEHSFNNQIQHGEVSVEGYENVSNFHVPILAMTADVIQATHEKCLKCGMDGCFKTI